MRLNGINGGISFKGSIIDSHMHYGHWYKYGVVEHIGNEIIGGEISIKYIGRTQTISIIANELFVSYHSTQLKGSKFFSTTKKVHPKPFDKPYEQEELENILSVRTDIELINSYMTCAEKIFRNWKVKQNERTF